MVWTESMIVRLRAADYGDYAASLDKKGDVEGARRWATEAAHAANLWLEMEKESTDALKARAEEYVLSFSG